MGSSVGRLFRSNSLTPMEPFLQTNLDRSVLSQMVSSLLQEARVTDLQKSARKSDGGLFAIRSADFLESQLLYGILARTKCITILSIGLKKSRFFSSALYCKVAADFLFFI
jgi:hypothetical protein